MKEPLNTNILNSEWYLLFQWIQRQGTVGQRIEHPCFPQCGLILDLALFHMTAESESDRCHTQKLHQTQKKEPPSLDPLIFHSPMSQAVYWMVDLRINPQLIHKNVVNLCDKWITGNCLGKRDLRGSISWINQLGHKYYTMLIRRHTEKEKAPRNKRRYCNPGNRNWIDVALVVWRTWSCFVHKTHFCRSLRFFSHSRKHTYTIYYINILFFTLFKFHA
jgi:hypothetical protein